MTRVKATALTLSATALLVLLVVLAVLQSCGGNRTKEAQSSPSGLYEADLIENDTGAPGPFSRESPVGGNAVRTLQQFLNSVARRAAFLLGMPAALLWLCCCPEV
jgi:hypothetical protein